MSKEGLEQDSNVFFSLSYVPQESMVREVRKGWKYGKMNSLRETNKP